MKNKEQNTKKDILFLKLKQNKSFIKREVYYSDLKDFDIIKERIINAISEKEKGKNLYNFFPVLILNHPEINEIYIYSKDQWDIYYKFNIIEECITNKTLKIDFYPKIKNEEISSEKIIRENNKIIFKYILQNLPLDLYLNILINFLKENNDILKSFELFLIDELIKNDISSTPNIVEDDLDENININSIINSGGIEEDKKLKIKKSIIGINEINEQYYLHRKEFISILDERFKTFSKNQKSFEEIKKNFNEKNNYLSDIKIKEEYKHKTSLELKNDQSFDRMSLSDDKDEINNNILFTVLNPPSQYVKNLMNKDKFFKKFSKDEYYIGLEDYKDQLNREYMEIFRNK